MLFIFPFSVPQTVFKSQHGSFQKHQRSFDLAHLWFRLGVLGYSEQALGFRVFGVE